MSDSILILTECGSEIGFGHVTRCVSLAQAFRNAGREATLLISVHGQMQVQLPSGAQVVTWYDLPDPLGTSLRQAYAVVLDSLVVTTTQLERIAVTTSRLAVIDDWVRRPHRHGVVIDWTVGAERFAYPVKNPNVHYLLGSCYCALRPEFSAVPQRTFYDSPRAVLVTFGGGDVRQLTAPVLRLLDSHFPTLSRHVIVGDGVRDKSFMNAWHNDAGTAFHVGCDAGEMRSVMAQTDVAICAGGQTLYELASQGLPPLVIGVADNQQDDIREFGAAGFALVVGDWNTSGLFSKLVAAISSIWPATERRRLSAIGRQCIDGRGAQRLITACLNHWGKQTANA